MEKGNEFLDMRFNISEELNQVIIEMLVMKQLMDFNPSFKQLYEKHFNELREQFILGFRKENKENIKKYNELINK